MKYPWQSFGVNRHSRYFNSHKNDAAPCPAGRSCQSPHEQPASWEAGLAVSESHRSTPLRAWVGFARRWCQATRSSSVQVSRNLLLLRDNAHVSLSGMVLIEASQKRALLLPTVTTSRQRAVSCLRASLLPVFVADRRLIAVAVWRLLDHPSRGAWGVHWHFPKCLSPFYRVLEETRTTQRYSKVLTPMGMACVSEGEVELYC